MTKTHLVIPDPHAHPEHNNDRADLLAKLLIDLRPDVVINLGDQWDMASLSGYDKGKKSFEGRSVARDIAAGQEFSERMWGPVKRNKKRLPYRVFLEGNHEERIRRVVNSSRELDGWLSTNDLEIDKWYDEFVPYNGNTPGIIPIDGIHYAHYFVSGVMGRAISGEHPAYSLLTKEFVSCTAGHIHVLDYCERTTVGGNKIHGLVAGVFQDYDSDWAGEVNKLWWRGVVIKRAVENGTYDPEFVSLARLQKEYG
jgi:hypothetical protein